MNEWKPIKLGEVVTIKHGWPFKSEHLTEQSTGNPIVVSVGNFKYNGGFRFDETKTREYNGPYPSDYLLSAGDILLIMTCQTEGGEILGIPGVIPNDGARYLHNQRLGKVVIKNESAITPGFLYYYFLTKEFNQQLVGSASGTKIVHTAPSRIEACDISLPSLPEQKAISAILSDFDKKIELLNRQIKTLELMAESLFRHWFVEEANNGWKEVPLSSIARFLNGLACQKYPPENDLEKLPVLKIRELSGGISETSDWATNRVKPEYIVNAGDVIFAWSASLMVKVWDGATCVLNQHLFKVTSDEFPKWFYLMWCKKHLAEFISISSSHATTMGHIKRSDLDAATVLVPTPEELNAMSKRMTPLLEKQIAASKQIKSLEQLRNTLLPKLLSGEVRVSY
ncbi:restriction endonuclease subunit S [Pseudomonas coronafaciens]|uniref:restriction endonuclease subunit S n=1 Tax=Pseudomonas coronafaciens TaxID=53409 RepID=UPI0006D5E1B6|nr:restriction endonuclease subunit S [Pseudomonas coronafaciens]KPZ21800.1 putative HsdS protein [Pseudomonas coronafaciens pv. zizaniae]RMT00940.1 putative HsdS protein [Pseudomonas coronafaciens pv. oryzae]